MNTASYIFYIVWISLLIFLLYLFIANPQKPILLRNLRSNVFLCLVLFLIALAGCIISPLGTFVWTWVIAPPIILLILPLYKHIKYKKTIRLRDGLIFCFLFSLPWIIYLITYKPGGENWGLLLLPLFVALNFAAFLLPKIILAIIKWFKNFIGNFK